ncbi:hypothetical protein FGE12_13745 [Aggregicoccus sp. 17bor-14]|uniref:hypothetical protein n=1 Tax=Myxococcaceae TaxID=31 RepID=UPI00129D09FE|nr:MULTISPECIES: hypothetical protein [Myxococcaceae]MBF5043456.1 hypothetical protein [Simulacricoccus sp. 17bor-14]MRI89214.1 hypothetical protein [Aggregicoccus sp. 17bor-14]
MLRDVGGTDEPDPACLHFAVRRAEDGRPLLEVRQDYSPGPDSGFRPGLTFVEETGVLFVGAGTWAAAYALEPAAKLWEEHVPMGFWAWSRHGEVVLMAAELSLGAWDLAGRKLWERFVEPPWSFRVVAGAVHLEVVGSETHFDLRAGPVR